MLGYVQVFGLCVLAFEVQCPQIDHKANRQPERITINKTLKFMLIRAEYLLSSHSMSYQAFSNQRNFLMLLSTTSVERLNDDYRELYRLTLLSGLTESRFIYE